MSERPRVLLLIKGLGAGGAEQLLVNAIPHLDRDAFDYEVAYFLPWKDHHVGAFEAAGIPVTCLGRRIQLDVRVVGRLADLVRDRRYDVLDVHLPYAGVVSRLAARRVRPPVLLYTEHSLSVQRRLWRGRFAAFAANVATYGANDHIVAVSRDTARDVERYLRRRCPLSVVYNGIPLEDFVIDAERRARARAALGIEAGAPVVGHVAKLIGKKRQADLLAAARIVLDERPDVRFVIAGAGPLRTRLEATAASLGIADRVVFAGFVDDIVGTMASFDVFALSSAHEGLPTVAIESLALAVPVVATAVGGTPEVVDEGVSGHLVPVGQPELLAAGILELLGDEARRRRFGEQGAQIVHERFAIERRTAEIEALYRQLLDRSGAQA